LKCDVKHAQVLLKAANIDPGRLTLTLDTPSGRYPLDKDISQAIASQLGRIGITVNVVVNEWGTHLDKIKNRTTGDMFFLGWGPALDAQNTIEQLFQGSMTYSSYGGNKALEDKIQTAVTIVDPQKRLAAWAELQQLVAAEVPWVFLWQQHDLYGKITTLDLKGRTLMPGLTDAHVHMCAVEGNITDQHRLLPPSLIVAKAIRRMEQALLQGFTTVRDAGGADYGFREAVAQGI